MYDYQIACFNGANRTKDQETTDAIAVHPISEKCEKFIANFCKENGIVCLGGVAFGMGLLTELTTELEKNGFSEHWTIFSDTYTNQLEAQ